MILNYIIGTYLIYSGMTFFSIVAWAYITNNQNQTK